jgi:hypothetical protein
MKNIDILNQAINEANSRFKSIMELEPNFKKKAYLVLSSRFGQCGLTNDALSILKEFPKALGADDLVKRIKELLDLKALNQKEGKSTQALDNEIQDLLNQLELKDDVNIEIRFNPGTLDYELIQKIMESEFILKELTKSSLAPVLVSVRDLISKKEI